MLVDTGLELNGFFSVPDKFWCSVQNLGARICKGLKHYFFALCQSVTLVQKARCPAKNLGASGTRVSVISSSVNICSTVLFSIHVDEKHLFLGQSIYWTNVIMTGYAKIL